MQEAIYGPSAIVAKPNEKERAGLVAGHCEFLQHFQIQWRVKLVTTRYYVAGRMRAKFDDFTACLGDSMRQYRHADLQWVLSEPSPEWQSSTLDVLLGSRGVIPQVMIQRSWCAIGQTYVAIHRIGDRRRALKEFVQQALRSGEVSYSDPAEVGRQ
jgi:hypothetical protein